MSNSFSLPGIPASLSWKNRPVNSASSAAGQLSITAGAKTDWFIDPAGRPAQSSAPIALFVPPDPVFRLQAKVQVEFAATFDAGVLFVYAGDDCWAKLCLEYSPQQQPMIVSVVTRGESDDCNSVVIADHAVYLRLYRQGQLLAFHYSLDGRSWHLVRKFSLGKQAQFRVGFSAQSPTGEACTAFFSEVQYTPAALADLRSGE